MGATANAEKCSMYCRPGISLPCGNACISASKQCRKSWTTACVGERPASATKYFADPKHVDVAPTK